MTSQVLWIHYIKKKASSLTVFTDVRFSRVFITELTHNPKRFLTGLHYCVSSLPNTVPWPSLLLFLQVIFLKIFIISNSISPQFQLIPMELQQSEDLFDKAIFIPTNLPHKVQPGGPVRGRRARETKMEEAFVAYKLH